ncbi:MAG: hypothetical protein IT428_07200 [Planctomycetaceae bacterium]|nr:hypothetical protein [Planctomycetaceae bacterium]
MTKGSPEALADAIRRGADLRVYTEFRHGEHIDPSSPSRELIREVAEFGVTYLIDDRWTAGVMSLRQPIELPHRFGPRPSMSFFLYNQDGRQAIARPFLDGNPASTTRGQSPVEPIAGMPKYHALDQWDAGTNAPSQNFIYDFDVFRYCVSDSWREVLSHDAAGVVQGGSLEALVDAFSQGCEVKVAIRGLCHELGAAGDPDHEVIVQIGSTYFYTEQRLFIGGTHPVVRIRPAIPIKYATDAWDFGWVMARTDGQVVFRRCDPHTLRFDDRTLHCALRWFVR